MLYLTNLLLMVPILLALRRSGEVDSAAAFLAGGLGMSVGLRPSNS